jgi:hypothetical protein
MQRVISKVEVLSGVNRDEAMPASRLLLRAVRHCLAASGGRIRRTQHEA